MKVTVKQLAAALVSAVTLGACAQSSTPADAASPPDASPSDGSAPDEDAQMAGDGSAGGDSCPDGCNACNADRVVGCWSGREQEVCTADGQDTFARDCPTDTPFCTGSGSCVACEPSIPKCAPDRLTLRHCDSRGRWSTTTECASHGETCLTDNATGEGSCGGQCVYNQRYCVSDMNAYDICLADGTLGNRTLCDGGATSWEVCRNGTCTTVTHDFFGFDDFSGTGWGWTAISANAWRVMRVWVPYEVRVFAIRAQINSPDSFTTIRLGLWDETSGPVGPQPGRLQAVTSTAFAVDGLNSLAVGRPSIAGGAYYWIGINTDWPVDLRHRDQANAAATSLQGVSGTSDVFGTVPDPFPTTSSTREEWGLHVSAKSVY